MYGLFSDELNNAKESIDSEDFLSITIPSYSFDFGAVHFETQEKNFINVRDAYEPYRSYVRGFMALIVYGMAAIYLVKLFITYGTTQAAHSYVAEAKADLREVESRGKGHT